MGTPASPSSTPSKSGSQGQEHDDEDPATSISNDEESDQQVQQVQAYAKLTFPDGSYLMRTHAVVLGRDQSNEYVGDETPGEPQDEMPRAVPTCLLSREGGIMGIDISDPEDKTEPDVKAWQLARRAVPESRADTQNFNPKTCPVVPIHEPAFNPDLGPGRRISISRRHLLIGWDFGNQCWQCQCLGGNGVWVDDLFLARAGHTFLNDGSIIQIGSIRFSFHLPRQPVTGPGFETLSTSNEQSSQVDSSDPEVEDDEDDSREAIHEEVGSQEDVEEEDEEEEEEAESSRQVGKRGRAAKPKVLNSTELPKRGPGRPPKNGRMSQREMAERKREEKEAKKAKDRKPNKSTKAKGSKEISASVQPNGKRKYTKRKSKDQGGPEKVQGNAESGASDGSEAEADPVETPAKPVKEKKPPKEPKAPRSPSPTYDVATLTEEQKSKPLIGYVTILYDILSQGTPLNLTEIYHAMMRKYPYYTLQTSDGWRSSVRHNLGQNQCFEKAEKDGKGHKWKINPDVPFEREKKTRRASPPRPRQPVQHQQHIPGYGPRMPYAPPYGFQPPNGYPSYPIYNGTAPPTAQLQYPYPARFPATMVPPAINPLRPSSDNQYMSPYASHNQQPASPSTQAPQDQQTQPSSSSSNVYPSLPNMGPPINGIPRPTAPPNPSKAPEQNPSNQSTNQLPPTLPQQPLANVKITNEIRSALDRFKSSLLGSMGRDDSDAAKLIDCAIARTMGTEDTSGCQDHPKLAPMMITVRGVLWKLINPNKASSVNTIQHPSSNDPGLESKEATSLIDSMEPKPASSLANALSDAKADAIGPLKKEDPTPTADVSSQNAQSPKTQALEPPPNKEIQSPESARALKVPTSRLASPEVTRERRSSSKRPHETDDEASASQEDRQGQANDTADSPDGEKKGSGFTLELRSRKKRIS